MQDRQENTTAKENTADQEFTVGNSDNGQANNENVVNVKTLESCFNGRIDSGMGNIVDTVEDRIQNAIRIAIDRIINFKIELVIRLMKASCERVATRALAISERRQHIVITSPLENVSETNNTLHVLNIKYDTRNKVQEEVSELSVPETHFDRQRHTYYRCVSGCVHGTKNFEGLG